MLVLSFSVLDLEKFLPLLFWPLYESFSEFGEEGKLKRVQLYVHPELPSHPSSEPSDTGAERLDLAQLCTSPGGIRSTQD